MEPIKRHHQGIDYTAWWTYDGERLRWTAQLARDGAPFDTTEESTNVAGCSQASMRDLVIWAVNARIDEEIRLVESGQHPAGPFLTEGRNGVKFTS